MINGWWGCGVLHWWVRRSSCWEAPDGKKLIAPTLITPVQPRLPHAGSFQPRKILSKENCRQLLWWEVTQLTGKADHGRRQKCLEIWSFSKSLGLIPGSVGHPWFVASSTHTSNTLFWPGHVDGQYSVLSTRLLPEVRNGCLRNLILQNYAPPFPPYCGLTTNCVFFILSQMIISPNSPAPPPLLLYYRAPHDHLYSPIPQRFSSRDTQASHASLSFVQCLPHPPSLMAT